MEASPKDVPSAWILLLRYTLLFASTWKGISPQLHADNIKCTSFYVDTSLAAARHTVSYVKVVGQEERKTGHHFRGFFTTQSS